MDCLKCSTGPLKGSPNILYTAHTLCAVKCCHGLDHFRWFLRLKKSRLCFPFTSLFSQRQPVWWRTLFTTSSAWKYPRTEPLWLKFCFSQLQYSDRRVKCCIKEHFHSPEQYFHTAEMENTWSRLLEIKKRKRGRNGAYEGPPVVRETLSRGAAGSRGRWWRWRSRCRGRQRRHPSSCRCPLSGWWPPRGCQIAAEL